MIVSHCCGAPAVGNAEDYGICPDCREPCEFIDEEEDEEAHDNFSQQITAHVQR